VSWAHGSRIDRQPVEVRQGPAPTRHELSTCSGKLEKPQAESSQALNDRTRTAGHCLNCGAQLVGGKSYCPECGQKSAPPRLSLHEIGHELLHAFIHVDRSALSLVRQLLFRPGGVALDYVSGRRRRYFGPFAFLVVVVALASAGIAFSGFQTVTSSVPPQFGKLLQQHVNLLFFLQVPLLAAWCRGLWHGGRFNYAEYLVLCAYASGMHVLLYALVIVPGWYLFAPDARTSQHLFYALLPIWPLYFALGCYQFIPGRRRLSIFKGIAAVLLTQATTILIGSVIAYHYA
jgi:hypothetical protein